MKKLLLALCIPASLLIAGCKSTVGIQALRPADITLPPHINKLAVVNRSLPAKGKTAENIIEGVLTGEGLYADRDGGNECLFGLRNTLAKTPRFTMVQPTNIDLRGSGTAQFSPPLDWATIEKICKDNACDAVIALEAFDSDSRMQTGERKVERAATDTSKIPLIEFFADLQMRVTTIWRVYDPKTKTIIDEFKATDHMNFNGKGKTPQEALSRLPIKREAVKQTAFYAGGQYGYRISPQYIWISRMYYTRGNPAMKRAKRMAQVNDWAGAAEIWTKQANNQKLKIAGRAAYNMAVACEVQGKLDAAMDWAKKSYTQYGNKAGQQYVHVIQGRINDEQRLKEQMKE